MAKAKKSVAAAVKTKRKTKTATVIESSLPPVETGELTGDVNSLVADAMENQSQPSPNAMANDRQLSGEPANVSPGATTATIPDTAKVTPEPIQFSREWWEIHARKNAGEYVWDKATGALKWGKNGKPCRKSGRRSGKVEGAADQPVAETETETIGQSVEATQGDTPTTGEVDPSLAYKSFAGLVVDHVEMAGMGILGPSLAMSDEFKTQYRDLWARYLQENNIKQPPTWVLLIGATSGWVALAVKKSPEAQERGKKFLAKLSGKDKPKKNAPVGVAVVDGELKPRTA